jgi:hypothetical protein
MSQSLSFQSSRSQVRVRLASYHVLVEGRGMDISAPDGQRMCGFQVWRRVRAGSEAEARALAQARVAGEWRRVSGAPADLLPQLEVGALSRLSWLGRIGARDTAFELFPE